MGSITVISLQNTAELRAYYQNPKKELIEAHSADGGKTWKYSGLVATLQTSNVLVAATTWKDQSGHIHIRVYNSSSKPELSWDGGAWIEGTFKPSAIDSSSPLSCTSWLDDSGQIHICVVYNSHGIPHIGVFNGKWSYEKLSLP